MSLQLRGHKQPHSEKAENAFARSILQIGGIVLCLLPLLLIGKLL